MSDPWPPRPPEPVDTRPSEPVGAQPAAAGPAESPRASTEVRRPTEPSPTANTRTSPNRRALGLTIFIVAVLLVFSGILAGKVAAPGAPTFPPVGASPGPAGPAARATRADLVTALGAANLQVEDILAPYRPAESARLAAAPRLVIRAVIPDDPDHGRIVIYEFLTTAEATTAAQEQAAYVSSGVGRVQFPTGTQFVLRVVGPTVVFYAWSGSAVPDPARAEAIATALDTQGFGVPIPG